MCSITSLQMGEIVANVAKDMDTYSLSLPLGVTAGIAPFNFPGMIPLWFVLFFIFINFIEFYQKKKVKKYFCFIEGFSQLL